MGSRSRVVLGVTAGAVLIAGGIGGYTYWQQTQDLHHQDDAARAAATSFAQNWSARTPAEARYVGTSASAAAADFASTTSALGKGKIAVDVTKFNRDGQTATATLRVKWTLTGGRTFSWNDPVNLAKSGDDWGVKVSDARSLWHPKLQANDAFVVSTSSGLRGDIKGANNSNIMSNQTVYDVKIDPTKATTASITQLQNLLNITGLVTKLKAAQKADSKATISVITYRYDDYLAYENSLSDLTGVIVDKRKQPLATTRTFAQPILGTVGQVTAEMLKKHPNTYRAGQYVGLSGLQSQYDSTLRATPGFTITPRSDTSDVLFGVKAKNGSNITTTLDPTTQSAAEKALSGLDGKSAAIVALNVKTGTILAAANSPTYGIERALSGRYAPGSTMKIASTYALLTHGFDPNTKVPCAKTITVDGYQISNFEGESSSSAKFTEDFANSCNTAFVRATENFTDTELTTAAKSLGLGADWSDQVGYSGAYAGSVPTASTKTEKAVSVFGQGKVQASPLSLAVMAGSVARGSYVPPALVTSPTQKGSRTAKSLDSSAISKLRSLMRLTVTDGTATAVKKVSGGDVYAKTGTSEYSQGGSTGANAWLAGYQGNVAFCVLVEDIASGKSGGTVAAPVAKEFLNNLASN